MNTTQIVRVAEDSQGVTLRLWIDDERANHVAVAECRIGAKTLVAWCRAIDDVRNHEGQEQLPYE